MPCYIPNLVVSFTIAKSLTIILVPVFLIGVGLQVTERTFFMPPILHILMTWSMYVIHSTVYRHTHNKMNRQSSSSETQ